MDFMNRPLAPLESALAFAGCILGILLLLWQARRRSRRIAESFLEQYPQAATLYLYVEGLPRTDGKIRCQKGVVSKVFDARDAPEFGISQGAACRVAPGAVELEVTVSWNKDPGALIQRGNLKGRVSFQAEPGCGYAAVFDKENHTSRIVKLQKKTAAF